MSEPNKIARWRKLFKVVQVEATNLAVNHHIYVEVRNIIAASPVARRPSSFHRWLGSVYAAACVICVRRLASRRRADTSLWNLLKKIEKDAHLICLERHVELWKEIYDGPDWETVWRRTAERDFAGLCGKGAKRLSERSIQRDLGSLRQATAAIENYATKRIAHQVDEPAVPPPLTPTWRRRLRGLSALSYVMAHC